MGDGDPAGRARRRAAAALRRARQLRARLATIHDGARQPDGGKRDAQAAVEALADARHWADDAWENAKQGYIRAIAAHQQAAARHDTAAELGIGDVAGHRRRALAHRVEAIADRAILSSKFGHATDD